MGTPTKQGRDFGWFGNWDYESGKTSGVGGAWKWLSGGKSPEQHDKEEERRTDAWKAQQHLEGVKARADRNAVDLSDQQARQVAMAARRRTGRGLSSTFVSGRGGGTLLGGG